MPRPRIGVRLDPGGRPSAGRGEAALLDLAEQAEALGFDAVWIPEHPTREGRLAPSALPMCAATLARTRALRVVTGLVSLAVHHPIRLAEEAATLDAIGAGRFELGMGPGGDAGSHEPFGVPADDRSSRFAEALGVVQASFRPGPFGFQGRHFQVASTDVLPKPVTPGGPPLWVGVRRAEAQRLAASAGAGLLVPSGSPVGPYLEAAGEAARLAWLLPSVEMGELLELAGAAAAAHPGCDLVLPLDLEGGGAALDALADRVLSAL